MAQTIRQVSFVKSKHPWSLYPLQMGFKKTEVPVAALLHCYGWQNYSTKKSQT